MRVSQLVCGCLVTAALFAQACGDDAQRRVAPGQSGAGGEDEGAAAAANDSGGTSSEPVAGSGGGNGGDEAVAGSMAMGGRESCLVGPEEDQPDDYLYEFQSGTRLQARYYEVPELGGVFAGFFDSELGEWCDFMLASDDTLRCLPRSTASTGQLGYADASCQDDVWTLSPGCAMATQPLVRRKLECADKAEVRALVPYSGVPFVGSECISSDVEAPDDAYTLGAEVPPSSFVGGTLVDVPGMCRAGLRVVDAADGARGPLHLFDLASGVACDPRFAGCRPLRLAYEDPTLRSDDACATTPEPGYATWGDAESCRPPDFVRPAEQVDGYYRAGPQSEAELYAEPDGGCEPAREKPWIGSIYELGALVPTDAFADIQLVLQGDGALQVAALAELGRPMLAQLDADVRFHHAALDVGCNLRQLTDGTLRCIPSDTVTPAGVTDEYNDADCSEPLRRCQGDGCSDSLVYDQAVDDQACSSERPTIAIWRLKTQATGYYRESPGFPCYAAGTAQPDMWTVESVDPTGLPEATLEVAE